MVIVLILAVTIVAAVIFISRPTGYLYVMASSVIIALLNIIEQDASVLNAIATVICSIMVVVITGIMCDLTFTDKPEKIAKPLSSIIFIIALLGVTLFRVALERVA